MIILYLLSNTITYKTYQGTCAKNACSLVSKVRN